ncbi:MAG: TIGR02300 family protein [Xanthobacteraceae bacterium]
MAKANLGTKRICPTTGRKFYDLNKDPVISPYTGEVVPIIVATTRARPGDAARAAAAAAREAEVEKVEPQEAELISLEEADAEAQGKKIAGDVEAIEDVEADEAIDDGDEDETFIEEQEEEDTDVTEIIGGDIEKEEET